MEHLSVDEILADFRKNGKEVGHVDMEYLRNLDGLEIERSFPECKGVLRNLLAPEADPLDPERRVIRPPSKTPFVVQGWFGFPTIPLTPVTPPPMCAPYVVDVSAAMTQMTMSDQRSALATLRPIFGAGRTPVVPLVPTAFEKRSPRWPNANAYVRPLVSGVQLTTPRRDSPKLLVVPRVVPKTSEQMNASTIVDGDSSSEDELAVSVDSGISTGGDLSSPGSELSPMSISGQSPLPSYASVVHTTSPYRSCAVSPWGDKLQETPKSRQAEGFKAHLKVEKQLLISNGYRSNRSSESGRSSDGRRSNSPKECVFCKTNGETPSMYRGHTLKDEKGQTVCHVLKKYTCPICGATGSRAHTVKYCPLNNNPPAVSMMATLKAMRSATGDVRDSRRSRGAAKRITRRTATGASSYSGGTTFPRNEISP